MLEQATKELGRRLHILLKCRPAVEDKPGDANRRTNERWKKLYLLKGLGSHDENGSGLV